jgi:hypothetical protein
MAQYFEVTVGLVVAIQKNGKDKVQKETYLIDAQSITEAESKVVEDFESSGVQLDYKAISAKESKIMRVID